MRLTASLQLMTANDSRTSPNNPSVHNYSQTDTPNVSLPDGCLRVVFSEMEYLPWDNPDNVVSAEVEAVTNRLKDILLVFLFLIGGPGNVINMVVFYKQGLRDRVNLCLFALSLADELYLIAAMFHHAEQVHLQFVTSERYGPMFTFLANNNFTGFFGFNYVSLVLSAIIASERCFCVLNPLKFQTLMRTRTMATLIIVDYVLVCGLYFLVAIRIHIGCVFDPETGRTMKVPDLGEFYKAHKEFIDQVDSVVFGAGLPGSVMVVVITTTVITIVKLRQIVTWRSGSSSSISAREVGLTKMLIGTSILFIFCVLPFASSRFSWMLFPEMTSGGRKQNVYLTTFWISKIMAYVNCSSNIFLYYAMGSRYRETLLALFTRKSRKSRSQKKKKALQLPAAAQ